RGPDAALACRPDPKLVALLAKAHEWFDRLVSGRSNSIEAIAHDEKLTGSHVTRVIHVAFLAPDIVGRIMRADHPTELDTHRLLRMVPLPISWESHLGRHGGGILSGAATPADSRPRPAE